MECCAMHCHLPVPGPLSAVFCQEHWNMLSSRYRQLLGNAYGTPYWKVAILHARRAIFRLESRAAVRRRKTRGKIKFPD